jgi:hypothetical protein
MAFAIYLKNPRPADILKTKLVSGRAIEIDAYEKNQKGKYEPG